MAEEKILQRSQKIVVAFASRTLLLWAISFVEFLQSWDLERVTFSNVIFHNIKTTMVARCKKLKGQIWTLAGSKKVKIYSWTLMKRSKNGPNCKINCLLANYLKRDKMATLLPTPKKCFFFPNNISHLFPHPRQQWLISLSSLTVRYS